MQIIEDANPFDLYGRWNSLLAVSQQQRLLGIVRAHDGDFFPESVMDYIAAIRSQSVDPLRASHKPHPIRVDIDITQACNAQCTFCFSRPYQKKGYRGQYASQALLKQVISELGQNGTQTIRFCGGGDPMVHPEITAILPLAHEFGMRLCVISNLDFVDAVMSEHLLEHVDHIRWSVNAANDKTRIKLHRPGNKANLLHVTLQQVGALLQQRRDRCPIIWATFLVLPDNFREMIKAAIQLREVGVDSVSFRPVFHGLGGQWTQDALTELPERFAELAELDDRPSFSVFLPKRNLQEAQALDPNVFFSHCRSRELRTVLEATSKGLTLQSCGLYRGTGSESRRNITLENTFKSVWTDEHSIPLHPEVAPAQCTSCIDVSMNVTLNAVAKILDQEPAAQFYRAQLTEQELLRLGDGSVLIGTQIPPDWMRDTGSCVTGKMAESS